MAGSNGYHSLPAELPALALMPAPAAEAAPAIRVDYGELLSPSQVNTFIDCPARWYFKYVRQLPDPSTAAQSLGSAFHAALKANFRHKLASGADLPMAEAVAAFDLAWGEKIKETTFADDEDPAGQASMGRALVETYMEQAAPAIRPALVEQHLTGLIGGVRTQGYVDLVDETGLIIDTKSAKKSPAGVSSGYGLQLTTYSVLLAASGLAPAHTGQCRLDTVTKTKSVKLVPQTFHVGEAQQRYAQNLFPMVQDSIRQGIYTPHRDSHLCSRKHCPFWRECEREFGGTVE